MSSVTGNTFIGRLVRIHPQHNIGSIEPLWSEKSEAPWLESLGNAAELLFPERGHVFVRGVPHGALLHSLWTFRAQVNLHQNAEEDFVAEDMRSASVTTLVDVRGLGYENVRFQLTKSSEGLRLHFRPEGRVVLWLRDDLWMGPLSLEEQGGRWHIASTERRENIPCFCPRDIEKFKARFSVSQDQKQAILLGPQALAGRTSAGGRDWDCDEAVLKRALKIQSAPPGEQPLTKAQIEALVSALDASLFNDSTDPRDVDRRERVGELVMMLKRNQKIGGQLGQTILSIPAAKELLEQEQKRICREYRDEVEREEAHLKQEIEALQIQKRDVSEFLDIQKDEVETLSKSIRALESDLKQKTEGAERELTSRLEEAQEALRARWDTFRNNVIPDLAELEVVRVLMGAPQQSRTNTGSTAVASAVADDASSWPWNEAHPVTNADAKTFARTLKSAIGAATMHSEGVAGQIARALQVAFGSDALPVLAGDGARATVEAFGKIAVGGRVLWMPVAPTFLEPCDLCGTGVGTEWRRAPSGLLALLEKARQVEGTSEDRLFLVVLEGLNRAPVESFLGPIVNAFRERWTPGSAGFPAIRGQAPLIWPSNVLLAATLCDGAARVAPSPAFWSDAVLLPLDRFQSDEDELPNLRCAQPLSQVSPELWRQWRASAANGATEMLDDLLIDCLAENIGLRRDFVPIARQLWQRLDQLGPEMKPEFKVQEWLCLALPAASVSARKREAALSWVQNSSRAFDGWPSCLQSAADALS